MKFSRKYCWRCDRETKAVSKSASHLFHLVLSLLSFGLWIPVWFLVAMLPDWHCDRCGGRV